MGAAEFDRIDVNNDNRISRFEFDNIASSNDNDPSSNYDRFATVDVNHDGWLTRSEWRGSEAGFSRLDTNRDNRLSRTEYDAEVQPQSQSNPSTSRSAAWRTGYDRGISEGRAAGREDYLRNQGWDLEGQRELVQRRFRLHTASGLAERLSGRIPRGVPERVSRGVLRSARQS